jgi:hypothetical protein
VFFEDFQPLEGEFLIGLGFSKVENSPWFVLTNLRLIQRDGRNNEFKEVTLADVDTYQVKRKLTDTLLLKVSDTLVFKMKSGNEISFKKTLNCPINKYLSWAILQSIVA